MNAICFGLALVLALAALITDTTAYRRRYNDYPDYAYRPMRRHHSYRPSHDRELSYYGGGPNKRSGFDDIPMVGDAVGFAMKSVEAIIQIVKCIVTCLTDNLFKGVCNQMFPCLYDCFVGATFVSSAVEKKLKEKNPFREERPPLGLNTVYTIMKCLKSCATSSNIRDWESFVYVLYCVADQCICFYVFGQ